MKIEEGSKSNEVLQTKVDELNDQIVKLKDENKKRRKMIQQQQMLIEAGANSYYQVRFHYVTILTFIGVNNFVHLIIAKNVEIMGLSQASTPRIARSNLN